MIYVRLLLFSVFESRRERALDLATLTFAHLLAISLNLLPCSLLLFFLLFFVEMAPVLFLSWL